MKTYYSPSHEYIRTDGNKGFIGITDYAQKRSEERRVGKEC